MKLGKRVRYTIRVREYETVQVEVEAEISNYDLGLDDNAWAALDRSHRETYTEHLEMLLNTEVDKLTRLELETVADWSEISPDLAEDYLATKPANLQRTHHARETSTNSSAPSGRRVQRRGSTDPSSPRPLRPA